MQSRSCRARTLATIVSLAMGVAIPANAANADTITVRNRGTNARTLSDLFAFAGAKNTGARTTVMRKNDATDDINIAGGGNKNITVPNGTMSFTISWLDRAGKEIEADFPVRDGIDVEFAMISAPGFAGSVAVAYDDAPGAVPPEGFLGLAVDGKIDGHPEFAWFTIYDTSLSDGFIERDSNGLPVSPLFSGSIESEFTYSVFIPTPSSASLLAMGGLIAARRRRAA